SPVTFEGSTLTVKGTYSLLPCAFSTSSRSQVSDRSLAAAWPAVAASSTSLTMFWISFFCASSRFLSSLFCANRPIDDIKTIDTKSANTPRRCFIRPCLPNSNHHEQPIIGVASGPSQTLLPPALHRALHVLALCYHRRFSPVRTATDRPRCS